MAQSRDTSTLSFRARWRRLGRRLAWTALVLGLCVLFGRHLLLSWVIAPVVGVALQAPVDVAQASCLPTSMVDLSNLRIGKVDDPFLTTGRVEAKYRLWRSVFLGPHVEKLHAREVTINLAQAPEGRIRLPRFRWRRHRRHDDNEEVEPFLFEDLLIEDSTVVYRREGSPLTFRIEDVRANLPELRHGEAGALAMSGRLFHFGAGPLLLSDGQLRGRCDLRYDREMELLENRFSFEIADAKGAFGGLPLDDITLRLAGTFRPIWGRGDRIDAELTLLRAGASLGTLSLSGYYSKNLAVFDLTARLDMGSELAELILAGFGRPPLPGPRLSAAARLRFPRPERGEISAAVTAELGGKVVADLDFAVEGPFPLAIAPVGIRLSGRRLAVGEILAALDQWRDVREDRGRAAAAAPSRTRTGGISQAGYIWLPLPPTDVDVDLQGVTYHELDGSLAAKARLHGFTLDLSHCLAQLAGGAVQLTGNANWRQSPASYEGRLVAEDLDLGVLFREFVDPEDGRITGRLEQLEMEVAGRGLELETMRQSLAGHGRATVSSLALRDMKGMRRTVRKYGIKGLANLRFDRGTLLGQIRDGQLRLQECTVRGPSGWAELSGSLHFQDEKLECMIDAGLGPELAENVRNSRKYQYLSLLLQPRDGHSCFPTAIPLNGSLGKPQLDVERLLLGGDPPTGR